MLIAYTLSLLKAMQTQNEKVLETHCTTVWVYSTLQTVHLKLVQMVNFMVCGFAI